VRAPRAHCVLIRAEPVGGARHNARVEIDQHLEQLQAEGTALAASARRSDLDAPVSHLPDWNVRDVVTHVGGVHRWAAQIVAEASPDSGNDAGDAVGTGPPDDELIDWFVDGHAALVSALRAAPADLECFTFLPALSCLAFWARRQALETAVHRADVDSASGPIAPFDHSLALDGIEEILIGFGGRPRVLEPGVIRIEPEGGTTWRLALGAEGLTAVPSTDPTTPADATVAGSASDVYLWLWNRQADVSITGDATVADRWKRVRVRWS
jgi:uncharacterized protein (TIGR03083 family)